MGEIQELAKGLSENERALQRAFALGTLHAHRLSPRRLSVKIEEKEYILEYWPLLKSLKQILRGERNVELAVLYGSTARGDNDESSDLDILIKWKNNKTSEPWQLAQRIETRTGLSVDIAELEQVAENAPALFLQALDEGRVLTDRNHKWSKIKQDRRAVSDRAHRFYYKQMAAASKAAKEVIQK